MRMGEKMKKLLSENKKKACGITAAVVLLAGTAAGIAIVSGENSEPHLAKASQTAKNKVEPVGSNKSRTTKVEEQKKPEAIKKKAEEPAKQEGTKKPSEKKNADVNANSDAAKQDTPPKGNSAPVQVQTDAEQGNNSGSNNNTDTAEQPKKPVKVWHDPVYEDKWVVDKAAWDETISEPIYETQEIAIGNQSGIIISGDPNAYLLDNPNGDTGWHSELQQVQTGTNTYTVHHDEVGHWEKILVKEGYWE